MAMDPERAKSALLKSLLVLPERRNPADLERIEEALRSAEPLSRYPSSKLSKLSRICQRFELAQNDSVFLEGDESVYFYLLIEGTVVLSKADENGQRMVIREVSSFGWFGEDVLFEVSPCIDQIRAAISAPKHWAFPLFRSCHFRSTAAGGCRSFARSTIPMPSALPKC